MVAVLICSHTRGGFTACAMAPPHRVGGVDTRVEHLPKVGSGIAAVDTSSSKVDHGIGAVNLASPDILDGVSVPPHDACAPHPGAAAACSACGARQHYHLVTLTRERARQEVPQMSRSTGNHDLHWFVHLPCRRSARQML